MTDVVVTSNVLGILVLLGILGLLGVFLLKLYNILCGGKFYGAKESIVVLAAGMICYILIEVGVLLIIGQATTDATLLEYNLYNWLTRIFITLVWIFWFVEMIIYAALKAAEPFEDEDQRMNKRRKDRINGFN